jgi:bifunctional non-homologous end joining protein LigD
MPHAPRLEKTEAMASSRGTGIAAVDTDVAGVVITHPDKVLWPATDATTAVTKLDLARYYQAAADHILPHIAGRPLSIVRAPDGIGGKHFFQRHAGTAPMRSIEIAGEEKPFVAIETEAELVGLAQAAVLEIHPWGSRPNEPDVPERLIFDLDPAPDVAFSAVMAAAKEIRTRLEACGLVAFVKTTGGKGLHVVAPIKGTTGKPVTWAACSDFAKAFGRVMEAESPARYTTKLAKAARNGKIFIDYLRNERAATAVAPWSPRARPSAPVSVPISWVQLRAGFDPRKFLLARTGPLLLRPDPWQSFWISSKSLDAAHKKLLADH